MQKRPAHRQHLGSMIGVNIRRLVRPAHDMADGIEVDEHVAVHLQQCLGIKPQEQLLSINRRAAQPSS
ncbi:MAG: hypothetical protein SF172_17740 [Burkholderiales bacterium]|nr:hypothetical protein [Burkholderiales bacterium]